MPCQIPCGVVALNVVDKDAKGNHAHSTDGIYKRRSTSGMQAGLAVRDLGRGLRYLLSHRIPAVQNVDCRVNHRWISRDV